MDITSLMHSATTVMALVISPRTAQRKFPHQEHLITTIDCTPTHIVIKTTEIDHTLSITDATKETTLTDQDHGIIPNVIEAPVTTGDIHPTLYSPLQPSQYTSFNRCSRTHSHRDTPNHHRYNSSMT